MNPDPLFVYPEPELPEERALPLGKSGISHGKSTFNRSEELYETRPYTSGDDPRKINWKVYAHTGTLILREGELQPPPSAEYVFIFNTTIKQRTSLPQTVKSHFDQLINRAASIAQDLLARNKIVSLQIFTTVDDPELCTISPDEPDPQNRLSEVLAGIQPGSPFLPPDEIRQILSRNAAILYFTMPECDASHLIETVPRDRLLILCGPWSGSSRYMLQQEKQYRQFSTGGFSVAKI